MQAQKIESVIMQLKGVEQICTHMAVSDYMRASGDAEIFLTLEESLKAIRESLSDMLADVKPR